MDSSDGQHIGDLFHSLTHIRNADCIRAVKDQFCRRQLPSTELIFETNNLDIIKPPLIVFDLKKDQSKLPFILLYLSLIFREPCKCETHLRVSGTAKPLVPIELNLLIVTPFGLYGNSVCPSGYVAASPLLSHPLTRCPMASGIIACYMIEGLFELLIPVGSRF